ncbi:Murein DD-endopeptidase MepM and murein hydrolase activator NlpD, contain LysM domain [Butyrivibrio sp. ob235]|uniref:M23 family metallopeptidase n=1 Tax=Butyrivibrio sp. ob235 TaxID=1761780 RepID=UPI0008C3096B|nr:M23 family metallopeptidase [Butyrivibrio sp. ob235]SEM49672.1 Murein DD-endopeptidase MepM and murein hydrolase activator NlpD, contain LysM domain [Butyrivibrio sp. ob235]
MKFSGHKKIRIGMLKGEILAIAVWIILILPIFSPIKNTGDNIFTVFLNGVEVGTLGSKQAAEKCLREARRQLSSGSDELILTDAELSLKGSEVLLGKVDSRKSVRNKMVEVLDKSRLSTLERSYTVKINQYSVNLASKDDVFTLLSKALGKYDTEGKYKVDLVTDPSREVNVLTSQIVSVEEAQKEEEETRLPEAGIDLAISDVFRKIKPLIEEKSFEDYQLGLMSIDFGDKVEVVESYLPSSEIKDINTAIDEVTKDQETNQIYEIKTGDTLGTIAEDFGLSLDDLIAMNETIDSENSTIRAGDEIIVTVPEPELSVVYTTQQYYEEDYEADVIYRDNDSWYTTRTEVVQEPSAGHRKVVAKISYVNNSETGRDIQKEEVTYEAVPKIVERGTIVPPTYIKPISGGRQSSGFGRRNAPTKGASTFHKGVDWATPVGTAVMASNAGVVTRAGWGRGYGYVIYISHSDGRETRYGHLSKILVKPGQSVSQGQKIALSGNTGVSTGAHLHFEILINGAQVNPLNYLN